MNKQLGRIQKIFLLTSTICLTVFNFNKANALELNTQVTSTGRAWAVSRVNCKYADGTTVYSDTAYCRNPISGDNNQVDLTRITPNFGLDAKEGYYYKTYLSVKSDSGENEVLWRIQTLESDWVIAGFKEVAQDYVYLENIPVTRPYGTSYYEYERSYAKFYEVTLKAKRTDSNLVWSFGDGINALIYNSRDLRSWNSTGEFENTPLVTIYTIEEFKEAGTGADELNDKDEEDRSNLESQSSESQSDSNDASQDTATATTNLIGALRDFSTAMNGLSSSSCTLPEIQAYGFSLGNINLCHYTPPAWIQAVTSTIVSFITLKLAIHVFYRVMGALDNVLGKGK